MPEQPKQPEPEEPTSYYLLELRRRALDNEAGVSPVYPPLPRNSPWSAENPPEPTIDRRCDGDTVEHEGD
jgi:hypothetical protein